jgi:uncharacterized membrane protein
MLRDAFKKVNFGFNNEFRHRGEEPGRLENFSDAMFALAITLLLISTSPPTNFAQIKRFVWEIIPFALCIVLIILIWHQHFIFFYRYGLRNTKVIVLNTIFLVIVLFYVYPLKFLTKGILIPIAYLFDQQELLRDIKSVFVGSHMADLMIIYGTGAAAVFIILSLMYRYALVHADDLELNQIERFDTRVSMYNNLLLASVPALSVIVAIIFGSGGFANMLSGFTYFLYPFIMPAFHRTMSKRRRSLLPQVVLSEP